MTQEQRVEELLTALVKEVKLVCPEFSSLSFNLKAEILEAISYDKVIPAIVKHYDFTPKVKELEWEDFTNAAFVSTIICKYYNVWKGHDGEYRTDLTKGNLGKFPTLAEAKSACQEHYNQLVLSLLEL
jgi:hypothetical protein